MPQKLITEEFVLKAKKIHGNKYDYSKVDYKESSEKVIIICSEHGEFKQTPNNHLKKIGCPILIIHGTDDRIIPIWHGRKLFEKANEPKFNLWVENAGHNDDISQIAGISYWGKIRQLTNAVTEKQKE